MNLKQRMLAAARGQMPDAIPFAPRIDIWFHANKARGTLPGRYRNAKSADEIALSEGWGLHKVIMEFMDHGEDAIIDRVLGVYRIPTQGFVTKLPDDVERIVEKRAGEYRVRYRTPKGTVSGCFVYTDDMRRSGVSDPWIKEHILKEVSDYPAIGYLFENMKVEPAFAGYKRWADGIGTNGIAVAYALTSGSPMHHIMKALVDSTDFYYRHRDQENEVLGLAEQIGVYFRKVFDVVAQCPADVVLVGANFDDMLTYPPFYEKHIMPWLQEASEKLHANHKLMLSHTDGENYGLMDLIKESGIDVAEAVCPYPMTKVSIAEYYRKWCDKLTIFGGIPSNLLLKETTTDETFRQYVEDLFQAVAPGSRFILGVGDTTPPDACFERLQYIQEAFKTRGILPLKKNTSVFAVSESAQESREVSSRTALSPETVSSLPYCAEIKEAVMTGDSKKTVQLVHQAMEQQVNLDRLLQECLLAPMDIIGEKFSDGTVFIPEVLLSARALNEAMLLLEPALAKNTQQEKARLVLLGSVAGDLHDIGKNLVGIMLRAVGFKVKDMGINVSAKTFVDQVAAEKPHILALSALLTTTMPEFRKVIEGLEKAGLRDKVKIMVGGAPVTEQYAKSIGADAYGADAGQAVAKAKQICPKA
jgi:corrinoid protein of di/trimethylamine methyltransferase